MDIGTNSVRVMVVPIRDGQALTALTQQREVVRLARGAFADGYLGEEEVQRAVVVCSKLADLARAHGAEHIVAVATSALREARNRNEILERLRREAGLEVRTVAGLEEARLIYLGVASGMNLGDEPTLFVDIGGGSTEMAVGNAHAYSELTSLKVGSARLYDLFFLPGEEGPVSPDRYALVRRYVENSAVRAIQRVATAGPRRAIGSSGTIETLADVAMATVHRRRRQRDDLLTRADLAQVVRLLCSKTLAERRGLPGMSPERADIIVAGAAILEHILDALRMEAISVTERGLRDGLLMDYLSRGANASPNDLPVRQRSVLSLGRSCRFNEHHARQVTRLSLMLFDSAAEAGLHKLTGRERELLEHAAMLHDIGSFLSYTNHHRHTYYLIRNSDLLGFDQTEIAMIAAIARHHRRAFPTYGRPELVEFDKRERRAVRQTSILLRLAEKLDRTHDDRVRLAAIELPGPGEAVLRLVANGDCQLEVWGVESEAAAFRRAFGRRLRIEVEEAPRPSTAAATGAPLGEGTAPVASRPDSVPPA